MLEEFHGARINRNAPIVYHDFSEYFQNFDKIPCVLEIFGDKTSEVLQNLKVEFYSSRWGFMGVSDTDGHMIISAHYLKTGNIKDIYLDIIHELVHVRQHLEGQQLFDDRFTYVERPTEIEAYTQCIKEARRIGMTDEEITDYLKTPWIDDEEVARLARTLGIRANAETRVEAGK